MKNFISVVIIDTDLNKINLIKKKIGGFKEVIHIAAVVNSVEEGIKAIKKHNPKIIILDINLNDEKGFSLMERILIGDFEIVILENSEFYK
jgi:two-component system, LytTR family, response regulator